MRARPLLSGRGHTGPRRAAAPAGKRPIGRRTTARPTAADAVAVASLAILGAFKLALYDLNLFGADQVRDLAAARAIVAGNELPLLGPMFSGSVHLGPAFYYLLALPLWVHDADACAFLCFGLASSLAVVGLWWCVRRTYGPSAAMLAAILASPYLQSTYAASAWAPGFALTLSTALAALVVRSQSSPCFPWIAAALVAGVLVQTHPSSIPLLPGVALYAAVEHGRGHRARVAAAVACFVALQVPQLGYDLQHGFAASGAMLSVGRPAPGTALATWAAHLLDPRKWADAALLPYRIASQAVAPSSAAVAGVAVELAAGGLGLTLAVARMWRDGGLRWLGLISGSWLLVSMALLGTGAWWYLDVLHPWSTVLASAGLGLAADRWLPKRGVALAGGLLLCAALLPQAWIHRQLDRDGIAWLRFGSIVFPAIPGTEKLAPLTPPRTFTGYYGFLAHHGIDPDQVGGTLAAMLREHSVRHYDTPLHGAPAGEPGAVYFLGAAAGDRGLTSTTGLVPEVRLGALALFRLPGPPVLVDGRPATQLYGPRRASDGAEVAAPRLLPPVTVLSVPPGTRALRVGLRCRPTPTGLRFTDGLGHPSLPDAHVDLESIDATYLDLEWWTPPSGGELRIERGPADLACDLTAVARGPS